MPFTQCKIAIVGCGPAGMLSALKLSSLYDRVILIGPESNRSNDLRTTALMMPAIHILKEFGIWQELQDHAAPLSIIRMIDSTNCLIRSPTVRFCAKEIGEDAFGYNIPNTVLNAAITKTVEKCSKICRIMTTVTACLNDGPMLKIILADGRKLRTYLLVAADGRDSVARDATGLDIHRWHYPQTALVLVFSHQLPHHAIVTEFHTGEGPFTQVPLPGTQSSLVWVVNPERAKRLLSLSNDMLGEKIEKHMYSMLGTIKIETPVQTWTMAGLAPKKFAANRVILIGEAAHVFPPIGAQGLNLSIRDMIDLAAAVATNLPDPGAESVLRFYKKHRTPDIWTSILLTHILNHALLSNCLSIQLGRSAILAMLKKFSPLRTLSMREGMYPGSTLNNFFGLFHRANR